MMARLLAVTCLVCFASTVVLSQNSETAPMETAPEKIVWDGLRVTFRQFTKLPRTENDAKAANWTKIASCDNNGKFRGVRYVKDNDYAVVLLFDVNGYIAGIQCGIKKYELPSNYPHMKQRGKIFQDDGDHYTLTAYFTDPASICTTGRSATEFAQNGTGTGLYIQNGSNPVEQSICIPSYQSDLVNTNWTLGRCFPNMGVHYWYNMRTDSSCEDLQPVFLLYNKGQLTAFGWVVGAPQSSMHFEQPQVDLLGHFMYQVPSCLSTYSGLSAMHIYMTDDYGSNQC